MYLQNSEKVKTIKSGGKYVNFQSNRTNSKLKKLIPKAFSKNFQKKQLSLFNPATTKN